MTDSRNGYRLDSGDGSVIALAARSPWIAEKDSIGPDTDHLTNRPSIMVVDDQPANLRLMEKMLRQRGYRVRSFPRGRMALASAMQYPPDLILLDINMPEMSGLEVCEQLKSNQALASIPVIFLSAMSETQDKLKAFQYGGFDYLTKPVDLEEAQVRIDTQLKLRELQLRVERQNRELETRVKLQVREIAQAQMATIFALAKLADSRDSQTGRHLERVQMLSRMLAAEMSNRPQYAGAINDEYVHNIFHASPLHDIGKVAIPDNILLKPGKLTTDEFAVMKTHTTLGAETLELVLEKHSSNPFVCMGIEIARSHHERWDGGGYPNGLAGRQIPLSTRIMAVADCYDALRSKRCYKEPFSTEESRDLILRGKGRQFDPEVVSAFESVESEFRRVWAKFSSVDG